MTWFDALLLTLWAMLGALGLRMGLGGLLWAVLILGAAYLTNLAGGNFWPTLIVAALLGAGGSAAAYALNTQSESPYWSPPLWHSAAGLLGGVLLGGVLSAALALAFPLTPKVDAFGVHYQYPSPQMPPGLYRAVQGSRIQSLLLPVWQRKSPWQTLLIPDLPQLIQDRP
ncbi:hypothetical protein [Deinococcus radiophilus]|uniref:CvpA family protein n=1 Tax=Deinococcus radiophilus TaxID=32062 RepID=A0A431VPY7_9DEIO|nr:hypothetical protein [Deinococcus radiophilus]RTR25260.1 hypothetical protein EJ104_11690 [Deinococcus radiophilus]UFA50283.1 hypothetical protein LMT64_10490 [Deinococcus radiophilus]